MATTPADRDSGSGSGMALTVTAPTPAPVSSGTAFTALLPGVSHSRSNSTLSASYAPDGSVAAPALSASEDIQRHLLKQQQQRQAQQAAQSQASPDRSAQARSHTAAAAGHHHHHVHIHGHGHAQTSPPATRPVLSRTGSLDKTPAKPTLTRISSLDKTTPAKPTVARVGSLERTPSNVNAKPSLSRMGSLEKSGGGGVGGGGGPPSFTRVSSLEGKLPGGSHHPSHVHAGAPLLIDPRASLLSQASLPELQFLNSSLLQELQYYDVLTRELSSELECSLDHITQLQAEVKASHTTLEELAVATEVLRKECVRAEQATAAQTEKSWHADRLAQETIKKLKHALRSVGINPNHVLAGTVNLGSIAATVAARTSDDEREHRINMDSNASTITSSIIGGADAAEARKQQRKQKREARRRRLMLAEDQQTNVQIESEGSSGPESLDEDCSTGSDAEDQRRRLGAAKAAASAHSQPESSVLSAVTPAVSFATPNPVSSAVAAPGAVAAATTAGPPSGFVPESALHSLQESHDLLLDRHRKLELRLVNQQKSWADYLAMVQSKASMGVRRIAAGTQTEMVLNTPSAAFLSDYAQEKLVFVTPNIWRAVRKAHQGVEAERSKQQQKEAGTATTSPADEGTGTGSGAESARFVYTVDGSGGPSSTDVPQPRSRLHRRTSSQPEASYASSSSFASASTSPVSLAAPSGLSVSAVSGQHPPAPSLLLRNFSNASSSSGFNSPSNAPLSSSSGRDSSSNSSLLFSPSGLQAVPSSTVPVALDGSPSGSNNAGVDLVPTRSLPSALSSDAAEFGRSSASSAVGTGAASDAPDASSAGMPPASTSASTSYMLLPEFDASGIIRTPLPPPALSVVPALGSQPSSPSHAFAFAGAPGAAVGSAPPSSSSSLAHSPQFLFNTSLMMSPSRGPSAHPLISRHVAPPSLHPRHTSTSPPPSSAQGSTSPSHGVPVASAWSVMAPVGAAPRVRVNAGPPVMHHSAVSVPMGAGQPPQPQPQPSPIRSSVSPSSTVTGSSPPSSSTNKYLEMAAQASAKRRADAAAPATNTATEAPKATQPEQ